ncbi:MAG: hypothetical protein AMJ42_02885, partial [Deltaproteobacteria bacterium DG_8]
MELDREEFTRIFTIFKEESEEHIQKLNEGFLSLEKEPNQMSLVSELFRHSHSIKGSARMMGFSSIEKVAHAIETILGKIQKGEIKADKEVMDALYKGVDSLAEIIESLGHGKDEEEIRSEGILEHLSLFTTAPKKEEVSVKKRKSKKQSPRSPEVYLEKDRERPSTPSKPMASESSPPL